MGHMCVFIHKHLLSTYYPLNAELGPGDAKVTETSLTVVLKALIISEGWPVFTERTKYHK